MSLPEVNIKANLELFLASDAPIMGAQANERDASFDYCYNYFQGFRANDKKTSDIASDENLEMSCLQIGFYLASWGMFRGKSFLLQKSAHHYLPLIHLIAEAPKKLWAIDVDQYGDGESINLLLIYEDMIRSKISLGVSGNREASEILTTKVMLGVFGNIPAFDSYFKEGFKVPYPHRKSLEKISLYYTENKAEIDRHKIFTLDFLSGRRTDKEYPKAKIIDMVFFAEGAKIFKAEAAKK